MKSLYVCLALFGVCLILFLALCRPNFLDHRELNSPEGLSSWLSYQLEFHPSHGTEEASFTATLTNVSPYYLGLELNDQKFHGRLSVKHGTAEQYEIMDKHLYNLTVTSVWSEPTTYLAPTKSVTWTLPLSALVSWHNEPVTKESLAGSMVSSHMEVTLLPMGGLARGGNASQHSAPIQIPVLGMAAPSVAPNRMGQERLLDWCLKATSYP